MEEYNLESDPCDYRLIRINNCIQMLSCCCSILAVFNRNFNALAQLINLVSDLVYYSVSGCMTAQVAAEINHHNKAGGAAPNVAQPNPAGDAVKNGDGVPNVALSAPTEVCVKK